MDRLTFDGNFCDITQCRELPCPRGGNCTQRKVWEKLKAYEDTWLEPEQCENAKNIIELAFSDDMAKVERIRKLLKADKEGRLVVLPEGGESDGCGAFGIYAGTLNSRNKNMWQNKTECTDEAICAVRDYLVQ